MNYHVVTPLFYKTSHFTKQKKTYHYGYGATSKYVNINHIAAQLPGASYFFLSNIDPDEQKSKKSTDWFST